MGPDADHLWLIGAAGTLLRWTRDNPGMAVPDPFRPPGGPPLAGWLRGVVEHR